MKTQNAFIWDLDGTLLDSYGTIVPAALETAKILGLNFEYEEIHRFLIRESVVAFLVDLSEKTHTPLEKVKEICSACHIQTENRITLMPQAKETLSALCERGDRSFVYTHKGGHADPTLQKLGIRVFFEELVTNENGFPRKPAPDGVLYLIEKYRLDPASTFYVGDRTLDMDCAVNAGIRGILYLPENSYCTPNGNEWKTVDSLSRIVGITETEP